MNTFLSLVNLEIYYLWTLNFGLLRKEKHENNKRQTKISNKNHLTKKGVNMNRIEIERRLTKVEERAKSNTHQIEDLKPIVNEIHTMSQTMVELVEEVKHTNENVCTLDSKIDSMDARVDEMERAPADNFKKYKMTAVTSIISTVAGALATGLIFLIAQNV